MRSSNFSLPTQRCFWIQGQALGLQRLFSAYAEVFLGWLGRMTARCPFLCLRRGVSHRPQVEHADHDFSLPTQRCFSSGLRFLWVQKLFSAYAEVFPTSHGWMTAKCPFLCLRRGVSFTGKILNSLNDFSLPTQRCFRARALSGLSRRAFLCLRRGVSADSSVSSSDGSFSLPTQRCFRHKRLWSCGRGLFSAYAEVFLMCRSNTPG